MPQAECRTYGAELPREEETHGKRDGSLAQTVGANEASEDGRENAAVQQDPGQVGQLSVGAAAAEKKKNKPVDTGGQVTEQVLVDTESVEKDENVAVDEEIPADCILLCIEGCLNGFPVKFLVDSGATDCFVSTAFVESKELELNKRKEKVKINLADGTTRVSNCTSSRLVSSLKNTGNFWTSQ